MRRRETFANQTKETDPWGYLTSHDPIKALGMNHTPPEKGACPKCGKHIGRGIAFHVKRCTGNG